MESKEQQLSLSSPSLSLSSARWWSEETVAAVTGANKGIGFALAKRLAQLGLTVILTARDPEKGLKALNSIGLNHLHFYPLDVSDPASIQSFVSWFSIHFGALDILVNNAGVSFNEINENSVEHAEIVMKTNFYGPKLLTNALLPMFRQPTSVSRILNISSRLGSINKVRNPKLKGILENENLTEKQIDGVVKLFVENVKNGTWKREGWPEIWTEYAVSKLALNAYSRVLAKRYEGSGRLSVNCFCPGFTQTSMTGGKGTHTADAAADVSACLLLLPPQDLPTGKFYLGCSPLRYSKL